VIRYHHPTLPAPVPTNARALLGLLGSGRFPLTFAWLAADARGDVDVLSDYREIVDAIRIGDNHVELGFTYAVGVDLPLAHAAEKLFVTAAQRAAMWSS